MHLRNAFYYNNFEDNPNPPARQVDLTVANPGVNFLLVRTRLQIDMRLHVYSDSDSQNPPDRWADNMFPIVGVLYVPAPAVPLSVDDPIGGMNNNNWVIWDRLEGQDPEVYMSAANFRRYFKRYTYPGGVLQSFSNRKPGGMATQSVWLGWNWFDRHNHINVSAGAQDVLYDLEVNWSIDTFWKPLP